VKKEGEKDDKKTNAHPTKPAVTSAAATTEKKPAGTITGTPKPAVKKEDPKIKKVTRRKERDFKNKNIFILMYLCY